MIRRSGAMVHLLVIVNVVVDIVFVGVVLVAWSGKAVIAAASR
jgi:hypothetical protein